MSDAFEVRVPDIGGADQVDVVEVLVRAGDRVEADQGLVTLESDKASMELPSPKAGKVASLAVTVGDKVQEGTLIAVLELEETGTSERPAAVSGVEPVAAPNEPDAGGSEPDAQATAASAGSDVTATQLLVLGSGPGGYAAAFRAADLGLEVTMVERYPTLGGVCLNVGCIPSKALLHAASVIEEASAFAAHGLDFGSPTIDLDKLRGWKDQVVGKLTGGVASMAKGRGVTVVTGTGTFVDAHHIDVESSEGTRRLRFEQAIIAAGSQSVRIPGLPYDDPRVLDSTSALELEDVPKRLLIIGGGIIGLELAAVYSALGSRITVVELLDGLMTGVDRDLVRRLERVIKQRYEAIYLSTKFTGAVAKDDGLHVTYEGKDAPADGVFDRVLVAVGRKPNGTRIGAEAAGVRVDERGFIPVDRQMRTNVPHLFAIGDVAGNPMLAHKASHEGKVAAEVAAGEASSFDARVIPSVAYTDPEVAWAGLTETEATRRGIAVEKGWFPWSVNGRSLALGRDEGATKLLFDPSTKRIVGAGIVGPNAGDLIAETVLAIEMGCDAEDIGMTIHPHPTLSETVAFAAEIVAGSVTDLMPKRKRLG